MPAKTRIPEEHWAVECELGQGSFCTVYQGIYSLGRDKRSGGLVALKVGKTEAAGVLLQKEAEVLRQLKDCPSKC